MQIKNHRDFWAGVLFIVTGILFMILSRQYQLGTAAKMGPGYFPTILGGLMAVLGLMVMLPAFKGPVVKITRIELRMILLVLVAVAVYAFALPKLGFIIALFLLIHLKGMGWIAKLIE
jgi:hypothetical protein